MIGARRLAVIEEKQYKDPPSIIKFQDKVRNTQKKILSEIYPASQIKKYSLVDTLDKWLTKKLFIESELTFKSIGEIDQVFDQFETDLLVEYKKLNLKQSFFDGLKLILQWYRILAIDAFLQTKPILIQEIESKETKDHDPFSEICKKKESLVKKIKSFNLKINEIESHYVKQKKPQFEFDPDNWRTVFNTILKEEKMLTASMQVIHLENERNMLDMNVKEFNVEATLLIAEFKAKLLAEKENRIKNQDVKAGDLDVYYVNEFAEEYPIPFQSYKSILEPRKQKNHEKIIIIESCIAQLKTPLEEFKVELKKFYNPKYTFFTRTKKSQVHQLLKESQKEFESSSPILIIDKEYEGKYRYVNDVKTGLPAIKKEIESVYQTAANAFIEKISQKPSRLLAAREEAYRNFENEVFQYAQLIKSEDHGFDIAPIRLLDLYKESMNEAWLDIFKKFFLKELAILKFEFDCIQFDKTEYNKEKLLKLRDEFFAKKELLLREVVREDKLKQRYRMVFFLLEAAYNSIRQDPLFQEIEEYTVACQQAKERDERIREQDKTKAQELEQIKEEKKNEVVTKSNINPEFIPVVTHRSISLPNLNEEKPLPTPKKNSMIFFVMPLWQRILLAGCVSMIWLAMAFTIWGLLLEVTLAVSIALISGGVSVGGVTFGIFSFSSKSVETKPHTVEKSLSTGTILDKNESRWFSFFSHKKLQNSHDKDNILTKETQSDNVITH